MDAAAAFEDGEIVRAALTRNEFVPPLARIAEMRVRIDESRHHDAPLGIDLARIRSALKVLPQFAAAGRDDDAVARREPAALDRADIAGRRSDPRALLFQRRKREQACAANDEIGLGHSRKCASITRLRSNFSSFSASAVT